MKTLIQLICYFVVILIFSFTINSLSNANAYQIFVGQTHATIPTQHYGGFGTMGSYDFFTSELEHFASHTLNFDIEYDLLGFPLYEAGDTTFIINGDDVNVHLQS